RERGTLADAPAVADRERPLAAVEAGADRDATARAAAVGGVDGHVEHGRAHRALAVDAAVLPVQASVEVVEAVLERVQAALERAWIEAGEVRDARIRVGVGGIEGRGIAG